MSDAATEKLCVILGAGASCDVHGEGSRILNSDYKPPLAIDLFDIKNHPSYWSVISAYNGAIFLGQELAQKCSAKTIDIERELRKYADHNNKIIQQRFKHIPAYLRDLIYRASYQYTSVPSSYIQLVKKILVDCPHDVLFLILNYDNLLETALKYYEPSMFQFKKISQYIDEKRNAKVVKMHGSIDWFRCLPKTKDNLWESTVANLDILEPLPEHEILVDTGYYPIKDHVSPDGRRLYPILTAPLAGKGISDMVCPKSHEVVARDFIKRCGKFLIIGTSGLDEDLLELLNSSIEPMQAVYTDFVNKGREAEEATTRFQKSVKPFISALSRTYNSGFRSYLASEQFDTFIKQQV